MLSIVFAFAGDSTMMTLLALVILVEWLELLRPDESDFDLLLDLVVAVF